MSKKLTQKQIENRTKKLQDKSLPFAERKKAADEMMESILNPFDNFDPETFDPDEGEFYHEERKRNRVEPPKRLPTMGLKPRKIFEGQLIGKFESKQDLYLLIAWLSHRLSDLEDEVKTLKGEK